MMPKWLRAGLVLAALTGKPAFPQNLSGVSISFDHVAVPPSARTDSEPDLLWLRIRNNSRTPIQVLATAPQAGAQGVELVHEIVETSGAAKPEAGWISPPERYSPINEATTLEIQPHAGLQFSVPLNHVGPSWRLRVTFEFAIPKARSERQRQGTVDFTWTDIPVKERGAWKRNSLK